MRIFPTAIVGLFLVSPAVALPTIQAGYDLKCVGNMSGQDGGNAQAHQSPFTMTLHVDVDHKLFCENNCETREKISQVLPSNIIFRAVNAPVPNRLWVADTGQFSYTWGEATAQRERPSVRSAQGFCTKVVTVSSVERESAKQKVRVPATNRPIGQNFAVRPRSNELGVKEIRALINIQNHRPFPGSMRTELWLKGLAEFDDGQWVLTSKGDAIINPRGRLLSARTAGNNQRCEGVGYYASYCPP
jgi:hypothetical protein